nr:MAG TPA_asm: hypothetical protein [Caudoviricetes sp.]
MITKRKKSRNGIARFSFLALLTFWRYNIPMKRR